ncbi:hypothetical protein D7V88_09265, partial [Corallococcus terminator]
MAPSHRTLLHWLVIPGVSLGLLLLCALVASWLTRPAEAPEEPYAEPHVLAPAPPPVASPRAPV